METTKRDQLGLPEVLSLKGNTVLGSRALDMRVQVVNGGWDMVKQQ